MKNQAGFVFGRTLFFTLILATSTLALADTNEDISTEAGAKPAPPSAEVTGKEISADDLITNNNLRALSGSTSKWSFASQWNYLGGTISSPFAQDRPNIADASATTPKTDIDGSLNVKYNLNVKNSLLLGFGVRWVAPFTVGGPTNYSGTQYDAINPTATYQHIYKYLGIQAVLQVAAMEYTQSDSVAAGYGQQFQLDQENIFEVGSTGLSIGGSTGVGTNLFFNNDPSLASSQSLYQAWFTPYLEYTLTKKINFRTVANLFVFEKYRDGTLVHDTVTQSIGFGFSVTRDIFLYPNIQFLPSAIASSRTNVGLSATINLF